MLKHLLILLFVSLSSVLYAEDIEVVDTLSFAATKTEAEPDPNNNEYVFSLFGNVDSQDYKIQIDYKSTDMYGEFTDEDFDLTGSGKYYNYLRTTDGSKVWYFKHLNVVVNEENGGTFISLNGLIQVYGSWRRILATGEIAADNPSETIELDLGTVSVIPNTFLGYVLLEAGNAQYSLTTGISGHSKLSPGTYYRTELVHPDFICLPSDTIESKNAQLEVTEREDGEMDLLFDLLSTDNILYKISMRTGEPTIIGETDIKCKTAQLNNYVAEYHMYQFVGENDDYQVTLAVLPEVINNSMLEIPEEKVNVSFTQILRKSDSKLIRIHKASGRIETADGSVDVVYADLLATDGTLYYVTFPFGTTANPDDDAIVIDCGDYVGRIDYTKEPGWMGLVLGNDDADVHVTVANGLQMKGTFTADKFDYENSYVTTYEDNDATIRFADVQEAELKMDSVDNYVSMELTVMTITNLKYRFLARLVPMKALTGEKVTYSVDANDGAMMVCFRTEQEDEKASYHLQFQRYDDLDDYGAPIGNAEIWDFVFTKDDLTGISGEYGYAAGTLSDEAYHTIYENNTEIYLGAMAGKLTFETGDTYIVSDLFENDYHTHVYAISAQIAAKNGIIYELSGNNILLCVDYETGEPVEFSEQDASAIERILTERGIKARKVLKNGIIIIESNNGNFSTSGQRIE